MPANVLWIIAVLIAIIGVIVLISGSVLWGIILLVIAALVGPGLQHLQQTRQRTQHVGGAYGDHAAIATTTKCLIRRTWLCDVLQLLR